MDGSIYISNRDQHLIAKLIAGLPHATLLVGYQGCNLGEINSYIIAKLENSFSVNIINLMPEDGKTTISIENIRELYGMTKSGRKGKEILIVRVDEAHHIGVEAQNALLKLLEEPPAGVHFLLATTSEDALLSTIQSRAFKLKLACPSKQQIFAHFPTLSASELTKKWMLAGERLDNFLPLVEGDQHLIAKLSDAKNYASLPSGPEKTKIIIKYSDDYKKIIDFGECVMGIYKSLFNYFLSLNQAEKAAVLAKKIASLNKIIISAKKLNLNKRVIQMMMLQHL